MSFPPEVKEAALVACARHCCICHRFCGLKIELHHIVHKSEKGPDTLENCIPLCLDCHGDMRSYDHNHPKGTKYTRAELKAHRDKWYERVKSSPVTEYSSRNAELDCDVAQEVKAILPWNGSIAFLRDNNFAGFSFAQRQLDDLHKIIERSKDPSFEFVDAELEATRSNLVHLAMEITSVIAGNTWPLNNQPTRSTVPPEWETEQPERFHEVVTKIHELASKIVSSYEELIRACRRKLGA